MRGHRLLAVALILACASLAACGRPVTAAELDGLETRSYAGRSREEVVRATVTALQSLGYEVVAVDAKSGRVNTAPKLVVVHAARVSSGTAVAMGDSIAWTIDVTPSAGAAQLHAEPRLYSAGQSRPATDLNSEYATRAFSTLYGEIERNLPGSASTTSVAVRPTPTPVASPAKSKAKAKSAKPVQSETFKP